MLFEKNEGGFDWPFSREPAELKKMIHMIREYERTGKVEYGTDAERKAAGLTHGTICFEPTAKEMKSRTLRPSLWAVRDIQAGEILRFAAEDKERGNFDSVRPAGGLHIRHTDRINGRRAVRSIRAGEPIDWDMIGLKNASGKA